MEDVVLHTQGPQIDGPSVARQVGAARAAVTICFTATAADQRRVLQPLADQLVLLDSGLDSLCFAIIVAQLEDELGVDPFSELDEASFPVTFGEFVQIYQAAVQRAAG
jgi:acyl carrier protein